MPHIMDRVLRIITMPLNLFDCMGDLERRLIFTDGVHNHAQFEWLTASYCW